MADLTGKVYSWQTDYFELYKDLQDVSSFEILQEQVYIIFTP